ncbi:MAG: aminopeptidase P N-terminal domain-containing protein [Leptospiraceae bacterium]|nr:aminopeptidase P N-terminal domain-containing protein [Leptospiraceae bacterium]MCP5497326.1 aminopeptidase P N-terminal domain-containing protein [Leptospiraceae bacterium]
MNYDLHQKRIKQVMNLLQEGETLLLFAATYQIRNRDVEYKFRQDSDFFYLTGFNEPNAILVLKSDYSAMFVLPKDKEKETWTGIRVGKSKTKKLLNLHQSFDLTEWDSKKEELLTNQHTLYYFFGNNQNRDTEILNLCSALGKKLRDGKFGPERIEQPSFLHEMRMIKSPEEIEQIKISTEITKHGHISLMKKAAAGIYEYELESILENEYLSRGAWGGGYGHIVAGGKNATILHYTTNNCKLKKGDLVLVDSGAEKDYYTADVTRVFPVDKKFTEVQKEVYEVVLQAQKKAISLVTEGRKYWDVHKETVRELSSSLKSLKLLKGSLDSIIKGEKYKKFYMHKTGHWLGMDVHDAGKYYDRKGESRILENGQVLTIEPGLYFDPSDTSIPKHFRGIGIRIEDDILVNFKQPINLTESIPKEIKDIEAIREG